MNIASHVRDDGSMLLVVAGEVDVATSNEVREAGRALLNSADCHSLVVDLMDVSLIDSTGVGALVELRNRALETGARISLLDPSVRVARVLEITGLAHVFEVQHSSR